jgi:alkanesulfonate monooxygenase SsuD/methylene tetrahydromethanopterin reductase-like flavin-dependent oxidoreductase (luciferase family)
VSEHLLGLAVMLHPDHDLLRRAQMAKLAGRLGYVAVHVPLAPGQLPDDEMVDLIAAAESAMVVVGDGGTDPAVVRRNDPEAVRRARAHLDEQEDRRPLVVAVPLSVGRTMNEAVARADRDPRFVGDAHPSVSGIFGTFEQAQQQVLALARAGADVLLVTVPDELDVADVLAQVKALVVGATPALFNR